MKRKGDSYKNDSYKRQLHRTPTGQNDWRKAAKVIVVDQSVAVLTQEAKQLAKGVDELRDATGGCAATIYQFACGSVAYFAPDAPDFQEAGELTGDDLAKAVRVLDARGVPGD